MGLEISSTDHGFSREGAEAFKQKIHQEAIEKTKTQVGQIGNIRDAIEAGWQGQAQINFMTNLQNSVVKVQDALDQLDEALSAEFDNIKSAWMTQDDEMIKVED